MPFDGQEHRKRPHGPMCWRSQERAFAAGRPDRLFPGRKPKVRADGSKKAPPTRVSGAKSWEETSKGGKGSIHPLGTGAS
jgi:hypothetical protein